MKLEEINEGDVVDFPLEKRGLRYDEITGRWLPDTPDTGPEYIVADDRYGYSFHTSRREAEIALKKLKLKGKKNLDIIVI